MKERTKKELLNETISRYRKMKETKLGGKEVKEEVKVKRLSAPASKEFFTSGRLTVVFGEERVSVDYEKDLRIDEDNLDEELKKQPALYAYYGKLLAIQKSKVEQEKNELKEYEARLYLFIRDRLQTDSKKRPTQAEIEATMLKDRQLKERKERLIQLQTVLDLLWAIKDGLAQKQHVLLTLAANRRAEWSTDLYVKA